MTSEKKKFWRSSAIYQRDLPPLGTSFPEMPTTSREKSNKLNEREKKSSRSNTSFSQEQIDEVISKQNQSYQNSSLPTLLPVPAIKGKSSNLSSQFYTLKQFSDRKTKPKLNIRAHKSPSLESIVPSQTSTQSQSNSTHKPAHSTNSTQCDNTFIIPEGSVNISGSFRKSKTRTKTTVASLFPNTSSSSTTSGFPPSPNQKTKVPSSIRSILSSSTPTSNKSQIPNENSILSNPQFTITSTVSAPTIHVNQTETENVDTIDTTTWDASDWYQRGASFNEQRKHKDAIECYNNCLNLDPTNLNALINRSISYFFLVGDIKSSIEELTQVVNIEPRSSLAHCNLAIFFLKQSNLIESLNHLNIAIELEPQELSFRYHRGDVFLKMNSYQNSIEDFTFILNNNSNFYNYQNDSEIYYHRALSYIKLAQFENAKSDLKKCISLCVEHNLARNLLRTLS